MTAIKVITVAAAIRLAMRISSSRSRIRRGSLSMGERAGVGRRAPRLLRRAHPGFLVDRLDEVLADARRHLLMYLKQAFAPLVLFLSGQGVELHLAGYLNLRQR